MNRQLVIIITCFFSTTVFGQPKADSLLFKGGELFEANDFLGALKYYKEVVENYKSFKHYNQSVYNLAYTYDNLDSTDQAIFWYEKIRASNVKDDEKTGGRGIFEPYSNYKHYSTFNIANIEYNRHNYEKALDYYRQCTSAYPYYNSSGTDLRINKNRLIIYEVDCLKKLKKYDDALLAIIPEALDSDGSSNYESVVKSAMLLINENFDKKHILLELEGALKTLKQQKNIFHFTWRDRTFALFPYALGNTITAESFITEIKKGDFWKQITN